MVLLAAAFVSIGWTEGARHMVVTREDDWKAPGQGGWVMAVSYATPTGTEMVRSVSAADVLLLRSSDNGKTWGEAQPIHTDDPVAAGLSRSISVSCFYLDPDNGLLVRFLYDVISKGGELAYGDASGYGPHTGRIFYEISRDAGRTWGPRRQLIERGSRYNARHWARDVWYGRSSLCIEGQTPHRRRDGTIVIPAYLWPTDEYMSARFEEQRWPAELRTDASYFIESRCLLLRWQPDLSGLDFASGGPMIADGGYTSAGTLGSDEAAVAYLDDQRWFAVIRTGTGHVADFAQRGVIMLRQCLTTTDGGATWSKSEPLRFDDGGTVFSPCAWSQFVASSRTGKWYWVGNILPRASDGNCDPRYPLQIVELDAKTLRLKRDTVTVIEDKAPEDDKWVRFSNFRVYEERGSGDLILLMTKSYCEFAPPGLPCPAYRYRITLPR